MIRGSSVRYVFCQFLFLLILAGVPGRVDITSDKNGLDGNRYTLTWVTTLTGGADITDYEIKYAKVCC